MSMENTNNVPEIKIKLLIIGDANVGKTSMLLNYTDNYFPESHLATIGVEFKVKELYTDKYKIILQIWDTAGQERFRSITKSFFRNTNGIIFVYDITSRKSFKNVKDWIKDSELHDIGFEKILVGNKIDLNDDRKITTETASNYADSINIKYYETSALKNIGIKELFENISETYMKNNPEKFVNNNVNNNNSNDIFKLDDNINIKKKKKCC